MIIWYEISEMRSFNLFSVYPTSLTLTVSLQLLKNLPLDGTIDTNTRFLGLGQDPGRVEYNVLEVSSDLSGS